MNKSRRQILLYALATGSSWMLSSCTSAGKFYRAMPEPEEMPDYMSIFQYRGDVLVNGKPATLESKIGANDLIETGATGNVVFVLEKDAFQLPPKTRIRLPRELEGGTYALETGAALGVFAKRQVNISTPDAVVSIRGTGVYTEVQKERSYICTCYGETSITATRDSTQQINIVSKHHDAPKYVYGRSGSAQKLIQPAPFINHADKELSMIETLVGREMPEHE